jgi:hypothetical protein
MGTFYSSTVPMQQFQTLFCNRFHCPNGEYEQRALRRCLYWHARLLEPLLRSLKPRFFEKDLNFIQYLGAATDWEEARTDINNFYLFNEGHPDFLRSRLRLRVSGRKASRLARQLLTSAGT